MSQALRVVRVLLDEAQVVVVCSYCQKEFGVPEPPEVVEVSHGICRRHFIQFMRSAGFSNQEIEADLASVQQPVVDIGSLKPEERQDWRKVFTWA